MMKMMFTNSTEKDLQPKQEGGAGDMERFSKASSSSRQWPGFKNPRIVRVSRSFGGKDRHSKVCTVRGLRDRRIRLSVPTAVQLYDLQDKLGLGQPSKVVDWLLDATKHEIDKLPPLQMPLGNFSEFHQPSLVSREPNAPQSSVSSFFDVSPAYIKDGGTQSLPSTKLGSKMIDYNVGDDVKMARTSAWDSDATLRAKCKEVEREITIERTNWMKGNGQGHGAGAGGNIAQVPVQNFFPVSYNSSFPSTLNNPMSYNSYINHWDPSNLSVSQFGGNVFLPQADLHTTHSMVLPSSLALQSEPQLFIRPSAATPSFFPPYHPYITTPLENDPRQVNQFQFLGSGSQHFVPNSLMPSLQTSSSTLKSSPLNVNPKVRLHSLNNNESQAN